MKCSKEDVIESIASIDIMQQIVLDENNSDQVNFIKPQSQYDNINNYNKNKKITSRKTKPKNYDAIDTKILKIYPHIQANHGRSFELHVLMIYDIEQQKMMRSMSVLDYKKNFKMILRENPSSMSIYKIEVMPGKSYPAMQIPIKAGPALADCLIFCFIIDKDVPSMDDKEFILSSNILRKVIVGNLSEIKLVINRVGAFIKKPKS